MEHTKLVYLEDMDIIDSSAEIVDIRPIDAEKGDGKIVIMLDRTIFYPQGGGQPYDQGYIRSASGIFRVEEVRFVEGVVWHIGALESGGFLPGETVLCQVDGQRRTLHACLHSGGHVIDLAIQQMSVHWTPGKGYHFPQGPYIEYTGNIEDAGDIELFKKKLEEAANKIIEQGDSVTIQFMEKEKMHEVCKFVPEFLPPGKPARVVMYGAAGIPCGGTHVNNLRQIGHLTVRKIKKEKDVIRISYEIA